VSPAGSTGTMQFSDNAGSESGEEQKCRTSAASKLSLSRSPRRRHKVSVLPEEYDASSGHTPPGFEGTWRETNARCGTARPLVPGQTSSPHVPPGPFYCPPATRDQVQVKMGARRPLLLAVFVACQRVSKSSK
jgi:hypothetical protein